MPKHSAKWVPLRPAAPAPHDDATRAYAEVSDDHLFINDRYQVAVVFYTHDTLGEIAHLSIKRLDREPIHDWRDLQRIKNDLCGDEAEAIEVYPPESCLVDGANQYHLWAFRTWRIPVGFNARLVSEASLGKSKQRPWHRDDRPGDLASAEQLTTLERCTLESMRLQRCCEQLLADLAQFSPELSASRRAEILARGQP